MRYIFWLACIILMLTPALGPALAGAPTDSWRWARALGGVNADDASSVAMDAAGNIYVVGTFEKTIRLNTITLTSGEFVGLYVAKYDGNGTLQWAKAATSTGEYRDPAIAVDRMGNCYITGSFSQTVTLGETTLTAKGTSDIFVAKCNAGGNFVWANRAGGDRPDFGGGIAVDSLGNCYITGSFQEIAGFGTLDLVSAGADDIFLAKYNGAGAIQWARSYGGSIIDLGFSVATDDENNAYITGAFSGDANFGPITLRSAGLGEGSDIYVAKVSASGDVIMAVRAGGANGDRGYSIAVHNRTRNIYVTGFFIGDADFGGVALSGAGQTDMFVAAFDNSGTTLWANSGGGEGQDAGLGLTVDSQGRCYITGKYDGEFTTAKFGDAVLSDNGLGDAFVVAYDAEGKYLWARSCGSENYDEGTSIAVEYEGGNGEVVVCGNNSASIRFNSRLRLEQVGLFDGFLARVGVDTVLTTGAVPAGPFCSGATFTVEFTASGPFTDENVFTLQLSDASGGFASPIVIGTLPGTGSGTISATVPMDAPAGTGYRVRVVSSSPAFVGSDNGGDLVFNGPVTPVIDAEGPMSFCAGDSLVLDAGPGYSSYLWSNGDTTRTTVVRTAGDFHVSVGNGAGCFGISDTVSVEVIPLPSQPTIVLRGTTLESSEGASYQWFLDGVEIPGATARTHPVTQSGRYTVRVSNSGGCSAMSEPYIIAITGVEREEISGAIAVYPQPASGEMTLEMPLGEGREVQLVVRDLSGREVLRLRDRSPGSVYRRTIDLRGESAGVYFIEIESGGRRWAREVVKR